MLSKLAVRRLTKLADYMDSLPPSARDHFDMGAWFTHSGNHPLSVKTPAKEHFLDCGSTACALGWASTMPYFRRLGLGLVYEESDDEGYEGAGELFFDGHRVQWDGMDWLGLTQVQAEHLFAHNVPVNTPKQWAKLCRKFLRDNA